MRLPSLLGELASLFRTVFLSFWAAFLLPAGLIVAIAYGGWLLFAPFLAVNILISYWFNKARKTGRLEAYDDKAFTRYEKSLEQYLEIINRSKEKKTKT